MQQSPFPDQWVRASIGGQVNARPVVEHTASTSSSGHFTLLGARAGIGMQPLLRVPCLHRLGRIVCLDLVSVQ